MRIAIIAAMPGELKPLVKGWTRVPTGQRFVYKWTQSFGAMQCVAVCAGMGADAATRAFAQAEAAGPLDAVLSIGWAGALQEDGQPGDFHIPSVVVNAQTGERVTLAVRAEPVVLVTTAHVADEAEKRRLAASYKGAVVDMESATIVRLAQMRGLPVCCMKVVTDEVTAALPNLNPFINQMGQMEIGRFVGHVLLRPKFWPALLQLGKASTSGADRLAEIIGDLLHSEAPVNWHEINRTGNIPD